MTTHPAAKAAQERAAQNAAAKKAATAAASELTNSHGLRFLHVRALDFLGTVLPHGGCTVAYNFAGRDRVNVALATCHKIDLYSKPIGRLQSADNFDNGHYITLRIPKGMSCVQFLKTTFHGAAHHTFE